MRTARWAVIIVIFYALVLALLLFPMLGAVVFPEEDTTVFERFMEALVASTFETRQDREFWTAYWFGIAILITAQALLLFVTVGAGSSRRPRPRQHVISSVLAASLAVGTLSAAGFWALLTGIFGDAPLDAGELVFLGSPIVFWFAWGAIFYVYRHRLSERTERLVAWLIRGSILELLIAVPAHVVARQRDDCCAPGVTLIGIGTGLAVMLMAFGPGVVFLYQRRIEDKRRRVNIPDNESQRHS